MSNVQDIILKGLPICRGIAIGRPLFLSTGSNSSSSKSLSQEEVAQELLRYQQALQLSRSEISQMQKELEHGQLLQGAAILDAHLHMIQDPVLVDSIESEICHSKRSAEAALNTVLEKYRQKFNSLKDPFFQERFRDIQDIILRILKHLRAAPHLSQAFPLKNAIIFSRELSVTETAEAYQVGAIAFVTERGSLTSHAAILAKASGTPYVSNIQWSQLTAYAHEVAIVDGRKGEIILNPSLNTLRKYEQMYEQLQGHLKGLVEFGTYPSQTRDGYAIRISANADTIEDIALLKEYGAQGVGLYRSESMLIGKERFPSEQEQYQTYSHLIEALEGLPIVIRTFDVGGDKGLPRQYIRHEANPFLGCRAIRFLLKEKELFKTQLRAILRASVEKNVSIMFPMISTVSELVEAKEMVVRMQNELAQLGIQTNKIPIGCTLEVPSAVIITDLLAKECDFLSIGTNDLVQYTLAVDRTNDLLSSLYMAAHPGVIRLLKHAVQLAKAQGIPISICGEIAADPRYTALLLGLGVDELSIAVRHIPAIKHAIRCTSMKNAQQLLERVLEESSSEKIKELITQDYKDNVPEDCLYHCD